MEDSKFPAFAMIVLSLIVCGVLSVIAWQFVHLIAPYFVDLRGLEPWQEYGVGLLGLIVVSLFMTAFSKDKRQLKYQN